MAERKKSQTKEQFNRGGKRIIATALKSIKDGKDDPQLGWPGCSKFYPPK